MNKKGIILSVYVYVLLVFFLLMIGSLLVVLNNTRILSDRVKEEAAGKADNMKYGFIIEYQGSKKMCLNYGQEFQDPGFSAKDKDGNSLEVVVTSDLDIWKVGTYNITYSAKYNNKEKAIIRQVSVMKNDYAYTGDSQTFTAPCDGIYQIELWGAQGQNRGSGYGGKGGYTIGDISLSSGSALYVYVGEGGQTVTTAPARTYSFNGGGYQGTDPSYAAKGGGATDIRLVGGAWDNINGLRSRIMVAGGGGNGYNYGTGGTGGYGGGLSGTTGQTSTSTAPEISIEGGTGGNQVAAGLGGQGTSAGHGPGLSGSFGKGGVCDNPYGGGGGGGYYGGGGGGANSSRGGGGGGGSSFISGYIGCNAIDVNGNPTDQPNHYSGLKFTNGAMLSGTDTIPNPSGGTEVGHSGMGYAKITYLGTKDDVNNENYTIKKFVAIGNNSGVKLRIQKPDVATSVMIRRKTSPWTINDTTTTGTLISDNITLTNADNAWYFDTTAFNGNRYYYKAFPLVNGAYKYLPFENEASAIGGGLVAEYAFEINTNDTSGAGANLTVAANHTYNNGVSGTSVSYNGTTTNLASPVFLNSGILSISQWAYLNAVQTYDSFVTAISEGGGYYLYQPTNINGFRLGACFNGGYQYTDIPATVSNKWVHIVYVINTTTYYIKIYYNGSLVRYSPYSAAYCGPTLSGADIRTCIGCNPDGGGAVSGYFNGKIDQVRMYNRELLPEEVLSLYNE